MTAWFKRKEKGIQTATEEKKDIASTHCASCQELLNYQNF